MKFLPVLFAVFALTASAADIAGTWKGSVETPNGPVESTFVFKVDGAKLTGTITTTQMGEAEISEGKVDGDSLSFAMVRKGPNGDFRINYKGKVSGDEMKITLEIPAMGRTFDIVAKRAS